MASRTISVEIVGNTRDLERALDRAEKKTSSFGVSLKGMAKAGLAGAAAGGVALLTKGLIDSVGAAKEAEKAEMRLGQAFDSAGVKARDRVAAAEAISRVSKRAALDDEDLSDVLARLTRATGDVSEAQKGMALAAEIARGRNVSLEAASKAVEKAMLGNDQALKRMGVSVPKVTDATDALKRQMDDLKDRIGKASGAQKDALKAELETLKGRQKHAREIDKQATATSALEKATKQFANSSEKYGKTAAGAQERFQVAIENLQESIGKKLLPVLTRLAVKATEVVESIEKHWPEISKVIEDVSNIALKALKPMFNYIENAAKIVADVVKGVTALFRGDWQKAWESFSDIPGKAFKILTGTMLVLPREIGELALKLGKTLAEKIGEGLAALPGLILDGLGKAASGLTQLPGVLASAMVKLGGLLVDKLLEGLREIGARLAAKIGDSVGALTTLPAEAVTALLGLGGKIASRLLDGVVGIGAGIIEKVKLGVDFVLNSGAALVGRMGQVGGWVVDKAVGGIVGLGGGIAGKVRDGVDAVLNLGAKLVSRIGGVGEWIKDKIVAGLAGIGDAIGGAIRGAIGWVLDNIVNPAISAANKAIDLANKIPGVDVPHIPKVSTGGGARGREGQFGGARAEGGPVRHGLSYLVGEKGPELFTPSRAGRIIPNGAGGAAGPERIQLVLDGRVLTEVVRKELYRQQSRNGSLGFT